MKKRIFIFILVLFVLFGSKSQAAQLGEVSSFYIETSYDISGRQEITATLIKIAPKLYFFADKNWWDTQNYNHQNEILNNLNYLSQQFESKIYPNLTSAFGFEWKPGIDGDERIIVLFHQMKEGAGGYFRTADEYLRVQFPESNEREMVYLTTSQIANPQLKSFLAHEFVHLITFNQKEKNYGVSEEIWLNEARAEYAPTFLGYDNVYENSNLQKRVKAFLEEPSDPITEWRNRRADYGALNLFIQYLVDHYGINILTDSLKSEKIGIFSINEALRKNGFETDFSQIFTNWTIAVLVNDCNLGRQYCYLNKNLGEIRVTPNLNFLPLQGQSSLAVTNITKNWAGNWQKFIGGKDVLKLEFKGLAGLNFRVPYLVQNKEGNYTLDFLILDEEQKAEIYIQDFNTKNTALIIIPSLQTKISGFDGLDPTYPFSLTVSVVDRTPDQENELIQQLLNQIAVLQAEILRVQTQINVLLNKPNIPCQGFDNNLYFGMMNSTEVRCLQEFLKNQGQDIYLEGLVTGNFLSLTQTAVIRFQERHALEILTPLGLEKGTGYVGSKTREKINQILGR